MYYVLPRFCFDGIDVDYHHVVTHIRSAAGIPMNSTSRIMVACYILQSYLQSLSRKKKPSKNFYIRTGVPSESVKTVPRVGHPDICC